MTKQVIYDDLNQLIHVEFDAESSLTDWENALANVITLCKEKDTRRVLVDVRKQKNIAGTSELFEFATNLPHRIAFAVLVDLHQEDHHFIETVATNRGIRVKDFDSEKEAIEWLKKIPDNY